MTLADSRSSRRVAISFVLATLTVTAPAEVAAQAGGVAERVQVLEDKAAIRSVLERFFEYQENGDQKAFAELFADGGELVLFVGTSRKGPNGMVPVSRRAAPAAPPRPTTPSAAPRAPRAMRHILSNPHIEVKGDIATATSRWTMLVAGDDNRSTRVGGTGRYTDDLVREDGRWKFKKRVIAVDMPVPAGGPTPPSN